MRRLHPLQRAYLLGFRRAQSLARKQFRAAAHEWEAELALLQADLADIAIEYRQHLDLKQAIVERIVPLAAPDAHGVRLAGSRALGVELRRPHPGGGRWVAHMPQGEPVRRLHGTQYWRRRARLQLIRHPLCAMCLARGVTTPATVADHIVPHHGDPNAFILGELQSLCTGCHSGRKQSIERRGYDTAVGPDGWPIDPNHPANRQ